MGRGKNGLTHGDPFWNNSQKGGVRVKMHGSESDPCPYPSLLCAMVIQPKYNNYFVLTVWS